MRTVCGSLERQIFFIAISFLLLLSLLLLTFLFLFFFWIPEISLWVPGETHFPCHFFRRKREWSVEPPPSFTYCQTKEVIFQLKIWKIVTFWKMERLACAHEWVRICNPPFFTLPKRKLNNGNTMGMFFGIWNGLKCVLIWKYKQLEMWLVYYH